jgi:hypothetical protein
MRTTARYGIMALNLTARIIAVSVLACGVAACEVRSPAGPSASGGTTLGGPELSFCADEVNRYRASVGKPPLARSAGLEDFAAQAAERDGLAHVAHHHFTTTNGGGAARAETEILWWSGFAVRAVIQKGLAQMWDVGPGGEHYDILSGSFSEVGCGIFVNGSEVTVTQDFR